MKDRKWKAAAGAAAAVLWIVFGITLVIRLMAGDSGLLASVMLAEAPPETTGLPEEDYPGVCAMTADYLTGKQEVFHYVVARGTADGTACVRTEVFQSHEAAHMADCRGLIRLDGIVCLLCLGTAAALTAAGMISPAGRESFLRGILWGLRGIAALAALLLAWALVNFDGLFVTFHRVAFPRGGWVLNPRTDLLIRLMPLGFFVKLGIRGLLLALIVPVLLEAAVRTGLRRIRRSGAGEMGMKDEV